jgi:hypothetical protein
MGERIPGVDGFDPPLAGEPADSMAPPTGGPATPPTVSGFAAPDALGTVQRRITAVTKDWVPPNPRSTPAIVVPGRNLAAVEVALNRLREWGEGGGMLRTDRVPIGTTPSVTVSIHANLVFRLPTWSGYASASAAAKAEWDRMAAKLRAHEQRHLDIAIEEAENLAGELIGAEIDEIPTLVTEANRRMHDRQEELDHDTDHGSRAGVTYGDVSLDTSIS